MIEPGRSFGRYRVERVLGTGGMGEVYAAFDPVLRRRVALKVLHPTAAGDEVGASARLLREARAAAALGHPGVVAVYDIGEVDGTPFIAMELVPGEPLRSFLGRSEVGTEDRLAWLLGIAQVLEAAHALGFVHRDVKPANVMVCPDGAVKLLDFGIAKRARAEEDADPPRSTAGPTSAHTAEGLVSGTPRYMAPEQRAGAPLDGRADQFAWGVVAFELLTGLHPGQASIAEGLARAVERGLPDDLAPVVRRALAEEPEERFQTMGEIVGALEPHVRRRVVPARASSPSAPALPPDDGTTEHMAAPIPTEIVVAASSRRRAALVGVAGLLAAGLVAAAVVVPGRMNGAGPAPSTTSAPTAHPTHVAVLPLDLAGSDPDSEFLAEGGADELVAELARDRTLHVVAHASVERYRGSQRALSAIGRDLDVRFLVTGRLRVAGPEARLVLDLVDAPTEGVRFSRTYTGPSNALLPTFRAAARDLAGALGTPTGDAGRRPEAPVVPAAYNAYLRGRYFWNKRSEEGLRKSIGYFEEALKLDPSYAAAWVGIADAYLILPYVSAYPDAEAEVHAREALDRALELDPSSARAHATRANQLWMFGWRFAEAETEYTRALALSPNDASTHQWYGELLTILRRFDQAEAELQRAIDSEPLGVPIHKSYGQTLLYARRYAEAETQLKKTIELDPEQPTVRTHLASVYIETGRSDEGLALLRDEPGLRSPATRPGIAIYELYAAVRKKDTAASDRAFARILATPILRGQPFMMAIAYCLAGKTEPMFAELDKAVAARARLTIYVTVHPALDGCRDDPRFAELVRKMGL
jgi:serine/threonine-protein kinase